MKYATNLLLQDDVQKSVGRKHGSLRNGDVCQRKSLSRSLKFLLSVCRWRGIDNEFSSRVIRYCMLRYTVQCVTLCM